MEGGRDRRMDGGGTIQQYKKHDLAIKYLWVLIQL